MSRIGNQPIAIPEGVTVTIDGQKVVVKTQKGELSRVLDSEISAQIVDNQVIVTKRSNSKVAKQKWGLYRTLINNMVLGLTEGFTKTLNIEGVGYRANVQGQFLNLSLGFSHEVKFSIPGSIQAKCPKPTIIELTSYDKEALGEAAAKIRSLRPPEPYKGKGVRYEGEYIVRKEGKK